MKLFFSDNINWNIANYSYLFKSLKNNNINFSFDKGERQIKLAFGNYKPFKKNYLAKFYRKLAKLNKKELESFKAQYGNYEFEIFNIIKSELLCYLLPNNAAFSSYPVPAEQQKLFAKIYKYAREDLILNYAAALFWLEHWSRIFLKANQYTHCLVFSGNQIYNMLLFKILEPTRIRIFVSEHFFVGDYYYLEERYSQICNNADIKHFNVYEKLLSEIDFSKDHELEYRKYLEQIKYGKNRNVAFQRDKLAINFSNQAKKVVIFTQVLNDFSVTNLIGGNLNILSFYKELIRELLHNTSVNIIVKTHPYERNKIHIDKNFIFEELTKFLKNFAKPERNRVKIIELVSLEQIFQEANYAVVVNSQVAIQAAAYGLKTIQCGDAFYGKKGFTYDCQNISDVIEIIKADLKGNLSLAEYKLFRNFSLAALQNYLLHVSDEVNPTNRLKAFKISYRKLVKNERKETPPKLQILIDKNTKALIKLHLKIITYLIVKIVFSGIRKPQKVMPTLISLRLLKHYLTKYYYEAYEKYKLKR